MLVAATTAVLVAAQAHADAASDQEYQAAVAAYTAADYQGAIKQAEAAVAADAKNWQAWQLDGNARYALGDKAGAVTVYKYALQINPGNAQLKTFVDSLEGGPAQSAAAASPAEATYQSAVAHYTAGDYDSTMKECAEAVRADPAHWQAWSLLGNARYARGDKRGALEAYDKSLGLHPDNSQLKQFSDSLRTQVASEPTQGTAIEMPVPPASRGAGAKTFADRLRVSLWPGYQLGELSAVNGARQKLLDSMASDTRANGDTITSSSSSKLKSGFIGELEVDYEVMEHVFAGVRAGYLSEGQGELRVGWSSFVDYGFGNTDTITMMHDDKLSASVIPIMAGGRYELEVRRGLTVGGGLFAGFAMASAATDASITIQDTTTGFFSGVTNYSWPWKESWSGSGVTLEALANGAYQIMPNLSAGLDAGYRYLKISQMKAASDVNVVQGSGTIVTIKKGDPYKGYKLDLYGSGNTLYYPVGDPVPFDFSGIVIVAHVTYTF